MFYDTKISILDKDSMEIKTIMADLQPYSKTLQFEDGIEIEIRNRVFCDLEPSLNNDSYLSIEGSTYKVMDITKWSDYLEILIYECIGW